MPYCFAVLGEFGKLESEKIARKRDEIAKEVGGQNAGYTYYYDSCRRRWMGWGYCENHGEQFDRRMAQSIQDAWHEAGVGVAN